MAAIGLPTRGKKKGDVSRTTVARFVRAGEGDPRYDNPELDDNGSTVSKPDLRLARGPMVGMTLGGRDVRVAIARDLLSPKTNLFITTRGSSALEVVSPLPGTSTLAVKAPAEVDVVVLRAAVTAGAGSAKRAKSEAENERQLAKPIADWRDRLRSAREKAAAGYVKTLLLSSNADEKTALETLTRHLRANPDVPAYATARRNMAKRNAELRCLFDTLEDPSAEAALDAIVASATVLDARLEAAKVAEARRAGAAAGSPSEAVVELRVGSATGPIVAELGVVLFPLIEIEIMPHVVSLGAKPVLDGGYDQIDSEFTDAPDFSKATFTYVDIAAMVARMNVILSAVGVRCFVQQDNVRRYRLHGKLGAGSPVANHDKWNVEIPGFDDLFNPSGTLLVGLNLDARAEPWANVLMNANIDKPETAHRLNVYFVREIRGPGGASVQAVAFNKETQTQDAAEITFAGYALPGVATPKAFTIAFKADPIGICVSVAELLWHQPRTRGWIAMGRALAHELGHMGALPHYLGGEAAGGPVAQEDIWAARNLMHYSALVTHAPPGASSARDVGYGDFQGSPCAGTHLTLKNYAAPTPTGMNAAAAPPAQTPGASSVTPRVVPYTPKPTQQASEMRRHLIHLATPR